MDITGLILNLTKGCSLIGVGASIGIGIIVNKHWIWGGMFGLQAPYSRGKYFIVLVDLK